jgi:hypothetical protein
MKSTKVLVLTAMVAVATASSAGAQLFINCGGAGEAVIGASSTTCRLTNTVSATVPTVARLTITSLTTTLTAPLAADFGTAAGVASAGPSSTEGEGRLHAHGLAGCGDLDWSRDLDQARV